MNTAAKLKNRLLQAEKLCKTTGARLTPIRKNLLLLIYSHNKHVTAYELLRLLRKNNPKTEATTVYRALSFLEEQQLIHRIESQNSYTFCDAPTQVHHHQILLCKSCHNTKEISINFLEEALKKAAKQHDFILSDKATEIVGICSDCHKKID